MNKLYSISDTGISKILNALGESIEHRKELANSIVTQFNEQMPKQPDLKVVDGKKKGE